ncbi:Hypothetical predicted protein, partial [Paramuricea clavata]
LSRTYRLDWQIQRATKQGELKYFILPLAGELSVIADGMIPTVALSVVSWVSVE